MSISVNKIYDLLSSNTYPGRGIIIGTSKSGKSAMIAYFIMGRSENSRNRVFEAFDGGMRTKAFDESKLVDPSLIIYNPFLKRDGVDIITNGDQTDTIYNALEEGKTFEDALMTREFEPDCPNFTPRISGILYYDFKNRKFDYALSILKSAQGNPQACNRYFYRYEPLNGIGHFIHTYKCDGNPIPSFEGEPELVELPDTASELAEIVWSGLNADNKVSLFIREIPLDGGEPTDIIINKNN